MIVTGTHDSALVLLSIVIAIAASYTALDLASRVRASFGWVRHAWLATAALAMGGGIWAMNFVAMLAFSMPGMEITYDLGLTLLSLAIPVLVTGFSFFAIARARASTPLLLSSGLFMGLGITAMHYLGMAAMQMQAEEAVGQLSGGVAHDFNNLLSVIMGNMKLLRKRLPDDPKVLRFLDGAMEGARRGASLTQRMLAFASRQALESSRLRKFECGDRADLIL